jgi:hypothetical protein
MKNLQLITKILFFGIGFYSIIRTIYSSSLFFLSYFIWFIIAYFIFDIIDKQKINPIYKLFTVICIWLSIIGRIYFYENFFFYDKILHIVIPFFITLLAYEYFKKELKPKKWVIFVFAVGITSLFEMFEYLLDLFKFAPFISQGVYDSLGNELMSPFKDTMIDLFLGVAGSFLAIVFKKRDKNVL